MKKLPILILSSILLLGCMVSCGDNTTSSSSSDDGGTGVTESNIKSVTISKQSITEYYGGTSVKLTATVDGPSGSKVNWSSSNEDVAIVKNGTVNFKNVVTETDVIITATSRDDSSKKDSVTFTVLHNAIDVDKSKDADYSDYDDSGVLTQVGDTALVFDGIYSTKWYVEASIAVQEYIDPSSDGYPKFGLMTTTEPGQWNTSSETKVVKNGFFYLDANKDTQNNVTGFSFVAQNDTHTDWNWASQLGGFSVSSSDGIKKDDYFRIGLLRDGTDYWLYSKKGEKINCYKHIVYDDIGAEEKSYAMIAGWGVGYYARDFKAYQGDEVDALFSTATKLDLVRSSYTAFINETYQIDVDLGVIDYDPKLLTFTSKNEDIATVDEKGLVTAGDKDGEAKIEVKYGDFTKEFTLTVTSDTKYNVVLDGKMDDAIYTENAKNSPIIVRNDSKEKTTVYGSRNSRGVYLIFKQEVAGDYTSASNWWEGNNIELRFTGESGLLTNKKELETNPTNSVQYWASKHANSGSNFTDEFISSIVKSDETGRYELTFEVFASYEWLGLTGADINTKIGFTYGSNLGGSSWSCQPHFATTNYNETIQITADGLVCSGHEGTWTEVIAVTCTTDGEEERTCKNCGKHETRVVQSTGEHNWDLENLEVTTPATCTNAGIGTASCKGAGCEEKKTDVIIAINPNNHTQEYDADSHCYPCCKNSLTEKVEFNYPANQNWLTRNYILGVMDGSNDWTIESDIDMVRFNGNQDCARGWAGQIQVENADGQFDNADANKMVWRQDWWGWGHYNPANGSDISLDAANREGNCGGWNEPFAFDDYKDSVLDNCNLKQTISYSHETGICTIVTIVTAKAGKCKGESCLVTYKSLAFPTDKRMEVGFGILWNMEGTHTINSIKYTGTVVEYAHSHADTVGLVTSK